MNEAGINERAGQLGYGSEPETRAAWQATRAFRAEQLEQQQVKKRLEVASLAEFKLGYWWVHMLTAVSSQASVDYAFCESRDGEVVRELIATNDPEMLISDGCSIAAACEYFADKPHGSCWFHVIRDVLRQVAKQQRKLVSCAVRSLYTLDKSKDAAWFLVLKQRYTETKLGALLTAWEQLKLFWHYDPMPLTNNATALYSARWSRRRKRVVKTLHRAQDWFTKARF